MSDDTMSAQRLSASKIGSPSTFHKPRNSPRSAQRLSASKIGSPVVAKGSILRTYRAQRLSASKIGSPTTQDADQPAASACSTPVGVKDRFTRSARLSRASSTCAQRLSASKIGSRAQGKHAARAQRSCSTPVGVKDRFTMLACAAHKQDARRAQRLSASKIGSPFIATTTRRKGFVLNACRRQRSVHIMAAAQNDGGLRVLNACRRQRSVHFPGNEPGSLAVARAQRLSASKIGSLICLRRSFTSVFGAQRLSASKIGSLVGGVQRLFAGMCSTPVGVKDRFTTLARASFPCLLRVLNACRRQRSVHWAN